MHQHQYSALVQLESTSHAPPNFFKEQGTPYTDCPSPSHAPPPTKHSPTTKNFWPSDSRQFAVKKSGPRTRYPTLAQERPEDGYWPSTVQDTQPGPSQVFATVQTVYWGVYHHSHSVSPVAGRFLTFLNFFWPPLIYQKTLFKYLTKFFTNVIFLLMTLFFCLYFQMGGWVLTSKIFSNENGDILEPEWSYKTGIGPPRGHLPIPGT